MIDERRPTLYLVDGPNLAFRAFFAVTPMSNSAELPTNALFGFTNMLLKLIRDEQPDHGPQGGIGAARSSVTRLIAMRNDSIR